MAAKSRKVIIINLPLEHAIYYLAQALERTGAKINWVDQTNGRIDAKKGINLTSWGENIRISVQRYQNQSFVDVVSECALPTQIVDWGRNSSNIQELAKALSDILNFAIVPIEPEQVQFQQQALPPTIFCPQCRQPIPAGTSYCPYDGTPIGRPCPRCNATNMPGAQFCANCGTHL